MNQIFLRMNQEFNEKQALLLKETGRNAITAGWEATGLLHDPDKGIHFGVSTSWNSGIKSAGLIAQALQGDTTSSTADAGGPTGAEPDPPTTATTHVPTRSMVITKRSVEVAAMDEVCADAAVVLQTVEASLGSLPLVMPGPGERTVDNVQTDVALSHGLSEQSARMFCSTMSNMNRFMSVAKISTAQIASLLGTDQEILDRDLVHQRVTVMASIALKNAGDRADAREQERFNRTSRNSTTTGSHNRMGPTAVTVEAAGKSASLIASAAPEVNVVYSVAPSPEAASFGVGAPVTPLTQRRQPRLGLVCAKLPPMPLGTGKITWLLRRRRAGGRKSSSIG